MSIDPYYQDDSVTIYHGDCREIVPTLDPVDLLLTDPPYGIGEAGWVNKGRGGKCAARNYGVASWDDETADDAVNLAIATARFAIVFGGNFYDLPPSSCWLVWDKDNGETDFADAELAWSNLKGAVRLKRFRWNGMLQEHMGAKERRFHPTQKPVAVMSWCIDKAPDDCALILDPFMGSGTTLRAAKDQGRKAIGIEIEERYCEIAANRCAQECLPFE